jgi:Tfp pilus assembly protein PilX
MQKQRHINRDRILRNEKGMVLAVTLMLIAVLVLLGTTAVMTITTDLKIAGNYRSSTQAFYIAEAGLEAARNQLRTAIEASALDSKVVISNLLDGRKGANSALSDSTNILNFYDSGAFVTDDVPYIAQTSFGSGTYRVYLTNDGTDG